MYKYELTSTRNLKLTDNIFKSYPDHTYLTKLTKLNRPAIKVYDEGKLVGYAVMSKRNRAMKLCLLIVHSNYKRLKLGTKILKIILTIFKDEFNDVDTLYTVCPKQFNTDAYQSLLIKNGFQITTVKANGEIVYSYAKSIQESNWKN